MQRRLKVFIALECYALLLALGQLFIGVRTDEAKYLLDIPYPHPPLARSIISATEWLPGHEFIWRLIFATLVIQAVWLLWGITGDFYKRSRLAFCSMWLLSAAVIYGAGTVMMAVLTGLQMLVFLWLFLRDKDNSSYAELIGLFWLAALFTAYQAVLIAPLVAAIFLRMRIPRSRAFLLWILPIGLLGIYTLSNPLAAASMINHAGKDVAQSFAVRLTETGWVWGIGGSIILSIIGSIGLVRFPTWGVMLSFLLVAAYVFLSRYDYYAILFTPFFMAGALQMIRRWPAVAIPLSIAVPVGMVALFFMRPPQMTPSIAPRVMQSIESSNPDKGDLLIHGSFGHEWQYESMRPVRRYNPTLTEGAWAVVCLSPCTEMERNSLWKPLPELPVTVFIPRD